MRISQRSASSVGQKRNQAVTAAVEFLESRLFLSATSLAGTDRVALPATVAGGESSLSLAFGKSTVPTSAVTGEPLRGVVTFTITNHGSGTFHGATPISLYASADGSIDSTAVLIETIKYAAPIRVSKGASIRATIKSLPATLNGTYTLMAEFTDPTTSSTVQATGPALAMAPATINFSEVVVNSKLPTGNGRGKDAGDAKLKITNHGNVTSTGKTTIKLYASPNNTVQNGTLLLTQAVSLALKPGMSKTLNIPITSAPSGINGGDSMVAVVVDAQGNSSTTGVTVTNPAIKNNSVFWNGQYVQTSIAAPTQVTGFFFSDRVVLKNAGDYDRAMLVYPGSSTPITLSLVNSTLFQAQTGYMPSQAEIEAAYPLGTYATTVSSSTTGASQVLSVNNTSYAFPGAVPAFSAATFTGMQGVVSSNAFTFNFNSLITGSVATQSFVFLTITDASNQTIFSKSFLNATTSSITLPASTLSAHSTYTVSLDFSNRVVSSSGSTPTDQGFDLSTAATLITT